MSRPAYLTRILGNAPVRGPVLASMIPLLRRWQLAGRAAPAEATGEDASASLWTARAGGDPVARHERGSPRPVGEGVASRREDVHERLRLSSTGPQLGGAQAVSPGLREARRDRRGGSAPDEPFATVVNSVARPGTPPASTGVRPAGGLDLRQGVEHAAPRAGPGAATAHEAAAQPATTLSDIAGRSRSYPRSNEPDRSFGGPPHDTRQPEKVGDFALTPFRVQSGDVHSDSKTTSSGTRHVPEFRDTPVPDSLRQTVLEPRSAAKAQPMLSGSPQRPMEAIRIGAVNIRIQPPPPPQPVRSAASATRAVPLARGFVSAFGLRQG
jgi:hypothetical protein